MENKMDELKSFLKLVNLYMNKFSSDETLDDVVSELDSKEYIYMYYKESRDEKMREYTGLIQNDYDVENNWYALSYAAYKFFNEKDIKNNLVKQYILKMTKS